LKRFILFLALGAGLLSCSESLTTRTSAGLAGTYDVALAGRYLFVTSSDRNELRVLDLEASPRDFVRAPNPLEALSIPVLERPSNLTRDMGYALETLQNKDGQELSRVVVEDAGAPYVYARSFGSREISIVAAADPLLFQERYRLAGQGLVTAFAARGAVRERTRKQVVNEAGEISGDEILSDVPHPARSKSVLYYAEQTGLDAKLYRVELPEPSQLTKESTVEPKALELALTGRTVTALLVLPPPLDQPGQESLVIATRSTMGTGGETFRVEVNNTQATRGVTYDFGTPVRLLATHTRAETAQEDWQECEFDEELRNAGGTPIPPPPLAAGQYIFGILDESSCASPQACSGVVAVESSTGARAKDGVGLPMLPISVGQSLPTGLTLAEGADVNLPCQLKAEPSRTVPIVRRPLVGIVPASNGVITLFDAVRMRPFDLDPARTPTFTYVLVDSAGTTKPTTDAELTIQVFEGVTPNDTYRLLYELALPGLSSLAKKVVDCPAGAQGTCLEVAPDTSRIEINEDVVVLRNEAGICKDAAGKELDFKINSMVASTEGKTILGVARIDTAALPAECQEMSSMTVRASGAHPFVVFSDTRGYLGRLGPGETIEVAGSYYYQPSATLEPAPKELRLTTSRGVTRGDQYIVTTSSHFLPYVFSVDVGSVSAGLATYRLPGPVVYSRVGGTDLAYIAYPSADGILQISLETITDNAANTTGLVPFE